MLVIYCGQLSYARYGQNKFYYARAALCMAFKSLHVNKHQIPIPSNNFKLFALSLRFFVQKTIHFCTEELCGETARFRWKETNERENLIHVRFYLDCQQLQH